MCADTPLRTVHCALCTVLCALCSVLCADVPALRCVRASVNRRPTPSRISLSFLSRRRSSSPSRIESRVRLPNLPSKYLDERGGEGRGQHQHEREQKEEKEEKEETLSIRSLCLSLLLSDTHTTTTHTHTHTHTLYILK